MSAIDTLLAGIAERRALADQKAADAYRALVLRLADGEASAGDTPAKVAELLERVGHDERRLAADVARVTRHRALAAQAAGIAEHDEAAARARAEADAARAEREEVARRLGAAEDEARGRARAAEARAVAAREALDAVLAAAPARVLDAYDDARGAVARVEGVGAWARALAEGRTVPPDDALAALPLPEALAERVAGAWEAVREAARAMREADEKAAGRLDPTGDGSTGPFARLAAAQERHAMARAAYAEVAQEVAEHAARALPGLRERSREALDAVLAADPDVIAPDGEAVSS